LIDGDLEALRALVRASTTLRRHEPHSHLAKGTR
jgi:hypothetical protein